MKAFFFSLITVAMLVAGCSREREGFIDGQGQAERDLAKGETNIAYIEGANVPFAEYTQLLKQRYGIGWCMDTLPAHPEVAVAWAQGYNRVTQPVIESRFGTNVLELTMAEAEKLHGASK